MRYDFSSPGGKLVLTPIDRGVRYGTGNDKDAAKTATICHAEETDSDGGAFGPAAVTVPSAEETIIVDADGKVYSVDTDLAQDAFRH